MFRRSVISSIRVRMMSGTKRWMRECEKPRRGFAWVERNRCREAIRVRKGHTPMRRSIKKFYDFHESNNCSSSKCDSTDNERNFPINPLLPVLRCTIARSRLSQYLLPSQPDAHLLKSQPEPSDSKPRNQSRSSDSSYSTS
jgi:hypothetical protein